MTRKLEISREKLKELYLRKKLSTRDVGEILSCNHSTILSKLQKYGISRRHPNKEIKISREKLKELYLKKKLSTYQIAKLFSCKAPTILRKLKQLRIKTRKLKKFKITKRQLVFYYVKKKYSIRKISDILGCSPTTIFGRLVNFKIPLRESLHEIYPKRDFDGDKEEMAYMLGFRYGDLGVTRESNRSIIVKCGTTKQEQIKLIKNLFEKYGHFWVGKADKKGRIQTQIILNNSFSFLLPKEDNLPSWIATNEIFFWPFFCGYTDAEGNIGVYDGRARVRIGSYDKNLLWTFSKTLNRKFGIKTIFRLESPKGRRKQAQDFWRIYINDRYSILKLLNHIKPLIRHAKRHKDMLNAEINVIKRIGSDSID